jgi:hypothetical protein
MYRIPRISTIGLEPLHSKLQGSILPPANCSTAVDCNGALPFALNHCDDAETRAIVFLPGTDFGGPTPNCTLSVNGLDSNNCTVFPFGGDCAEGAIWEVNCAGDNPNCTCSGLDTIVVTCDGFQQDTCTNNASQPCA